MMPGGYTNLSPDDLQRRTSEGGIKHLNERNPFTNPLCPNGHFFFHHAHPWSVAATNADPSHTTGCSVCHDTTLHIDAIWLHCISKLCCAIQVCKQCAFRCHAELATAIYLSNMPSRPPTILSSLFSVAITTNTTNDTNDDSLSPQRRAELIDRLTLHIAPLSPAITTFDAFRDAEAAAAFARPTTLTNPFFANPLTHQVAPDDALIHAAHHVANNTLIYRNRLHEQHDTDTQRLNELRLSLKRTTSDLRLLDRAAKERAKVLQQTIFNGIAAAAKGTNKNTKKKSKTNTAPPSPNAEQSPQTPSSSPNTGGPTSPSSST